MKIKTSSVAGRDEIFSLLFAGESSDGALDSADSFISLFDETSSCKFPCNGELHLVSLFNFLKLFCTFFSISLNSKIN